MNDADAKTNIKCFLLYMDVSFGIFIKYISFGIPREVRKLVKGHGDIKTFQRRAERMQRHWKMSGENACRGKGTGEVDLGRDRRIT